MSLASSPPARSRLEIVEGLRGLAALAVAWFHFTNALAAFPTFGWLRASGTYGCHRRSLRVKLDEILNRPARNGTA